MRDMREYYRLTMNFSNNNDKHTRSKGLMKKKQCRRSS